MYKDSDPDLYPYGEEQSDDAKRDTSPEIDPVPLLSDRLISWLESVDR